ncbi:MAG: hypothetical protein KDC05_05820 [Bacteroidales bacterium]|nr:hypothetical protein [Bacteroidales bacterium]
MKYYFLLGFSLLIITFGFSQQSKETGDKKSAREVRKARDKYLTMGTGLSWVKAIDNATSPLLYKGMQIGNFNLGHLVHSQERIKHTDVEFNFGWLKTRTETPWYDPRNTSYRIVIRHNILYRMKPEIFQKVRWYLGPEFNINGHFRVNYKYGNSALNFDNYNGVGIATHFEFPFSYTSRSFKLWFIKINRRDRNLRLSWQLSTPVLSFMLRPTYVTITNFIDPELQSAITADHVDGGFFVPFNLRSETNLYYLLQNGNMLRLGYTWNFYHHDPGYNKVQSAYHGLFFSFVFKFNKGEVK